MASENIVQKKKQNQKKKQLLIITTIISVLLLLIIIFTSLCHIKIRLNGDSDETVEYGNEYTEEGATAAYTVLFSRKKPLAVTIDGIVDSSKVGKYHIKYKAKKGLFSSEKTRTVSVVDTECPVIELNHTDGYYPKKGEAYIEEGYTAHDNYDGDITNKVTRKETKRSITYTVSDSSGNIAVATREIEYNDGIAPTITLNGDSDITMNAGTTFDDPGCTASDSKGNDLTEAVTVDGDLNTYKAGDYTITYSVTDKYGNESSVERHIKINPLRQADTVNPGSKTIYLTFDDGPGEYTQQLLDTLAKYNVKATFFVTDGNSDYRYLLAKEAAAGHTVAIHSETHDYKYIYSSCDAYFEDLNRMSDIITEQTGKRPKLLRFPGGSSNTISIQYCFRIMSVLTKAVSDQGYKYFDWNVSSGDAGGTTSTSEVYNNVISGIQSHDISVVLQHDIKLFSVNAVEDIIVWGLANGYTFLPLTESSPAIHHGVNN